MMSQRTQVCLFSREKNAGGQTGAPYLSLSLVRPASLLKVPQSLLLH